MIQNNSRKTGPQNSKKTPPPPRKPDPSIFKENSVKPGRINSKKI